MEREMVLARVTRALGVAGYSVEECDAITSELFGVPQRTPAPGASAMIARLVCATCGILSEQRIQPGMTVYIHQIYSCRCFYSGQAQSTFPQWRIEMHWIP